jgi:hypothetical protein
MAGLMRSKTTQIVILLALFANKVSSKFVPDVFEVVPLTDEEKEKGLSEQVRQKKGSWFTYGSSIADEIEGEAEVYTAMDKHEKESGEKLFRKDGNRAATWARIKVSHRS